VLDLRGQVAPDVPCGGQRGRVVLVVYRQGHSVRRRGVGKRVGGGVSGLLCCDDGVWWVVGGWVVN
jgi:hypothetical protein